MNCIITGASGFIGKNLVSELNGSSFKLNLIGKSHYASDDRDDRDDRYVADDYLGFELYESYLKSTDAIVHLAHSTRPSSENPHQDITENLLGTISLVSKCKSDCHFIYASTGGAMYGDANEPVDENSCPHPVSYYAAGKLATEKYLEIYCKAKGINLTVLRITNPYGNGVDLSKGVGAINTFIHHLKAGLPITVWGDGTSERDYIHVNDVAKAIKECLKRKIFGLYNVSYGRSYNLNYLMKLISTEIGVVPVINFMPKRCFDIHRVLVSNSKLKNLSGWAPQISLEYGISQLIKNGNFDQ